MSGRRHVEHRRLPRKLTAPPAVAQGLCASGKVGFATRNMARDAAARTGAAKGIPLGVYFCATCRRWHKTKNTWGSTQPATKKARHNAQRYQKAE